ncbi:hypothetical protein [Pseudomonas sp. 37 R 15]|uniref:hypothetical protein n=1 Tax=Pseudomonas sp. 37 R 15 TaxID=1844104 RepID=UPI0009F45B5C|nr:hypothetical protein [Pseudomonas sp. 37 R 15]
MKDYRAEVDHLLEELELAANELMLMIAKNQMTGATWLDATRRHFNATEAWDGFLRRAQAASESYH